MTGKFNQSCLKVRKSLISEQMDRIQETSEQLKIRRLQQAVRQAAPRTEETSEEQQLRREEKA